MKYSIIAAVALAAPAILAAPTAEMVEKRGTFFLDKINVADEIVGRPGTNLFNDDSIPNLLPNSIEKRAENTTEPDPNRPVVTPEYLFVLQCTGAAFLEKCLVFGSRPGSCVDYDDFNPVNGTSISDTYNNNVSSLSTNWGGKCQFYKYAGCNNKGDDPGVTLSYLYDLAVASEDPDYSADYENTISSWRC